MSEERGDDLQPGDEVPEEAPSSGQDLCPRCDGTGEADGETCPVCQGSGIVEGAAGGG